jgi:hypothetical protein
MSVHKKLMQARIMLQGKQLTKSGHNKFAGYKYFELGDFLPVVQEIFYEIGLCGTVSFFIDAANLVITDTEDGSQITLISPMSSASLKGCHDVQNLGAVQTYLRRYLWVTAMEIVEHDALDATTGSAEPERKPAAKKAEPKQEAVKEQPKELAKVEGKDAPWQIKIEEKEPGAWKDASVNAALLLLDMAHTSDDVMNIFKVNRSIFDKLKAEDVATYEDLMAKFKEYKENLGGV